MIIGDHEISANGLVPNHYDGAHAMTEPNEDEIAIAAAWIATFCTPRKTFNPKAWSYGLKHRAERWARKYVSNGAFVVAALRAGYRLRRDGWTSPNCDFAMSLPRRS